MSSPVEKVSCVVRSTPLRTEEEGKQDYDWQAQRCWTVVNDAVRSSLGVPVGYKLIPAGSFPPLLDRSSPVLRQAGAIGHTAPHIGQCEAPVT